MLCLLTPQSLRALSQEDYSTLEEHFINPQHSYGPWVVWHWTSCNQTREGVTSDLEGMAAAGITAANLFSFPPGGRGFGGGGTVVENPAEPLTPEWFELVNHAVAEAQRVGITLSMQISAGWATAGGDWIPPELSQQQIVWSEVEVKGRKLADIQLERPRREGSQRDPKEWQDYYRDLAVLAFPVPEDWNETNLSKKAKVTSNLPVTDLTKLTDLENRDAVIDTAEAGWIQFEFRKPFTLRSVRMNPGGGGFFGSFNRPAHSMEVQASEDGINFKKIGALEPMANSWQTRLTGLVHVVPETTARFFRLVHHPAPPIGYDEHMQGDSYTGSGGVFGQTAAVSEDQPDMLDTINKLSIRSIQLSSTARVHHYEGKTALVWGMSRRITSSELPPSSCIPQDSIVDLTDRMNEEGLIGQWTPPTKGNWRIMRFGYTTMGRTNGSGTGQGLEADKFSADGARVSFNGWYKRVQDYIGPELSLKVLNMLNVDSWECQSQNWSPVFRDEFRERRGYDVLNYLPVMAGIPVRDMETTENFLFDIRRTIADLIADNFYATLRDLAHSNGSDVQTESVPPGMMSDGLLIHKNVDVTAGEFWVTAWQNWKPCDIAEASSGAHIYGKQIAMAEAFTGGGSWKEHPYDLKAMGDMHFADGINRMMIHLWAAQPYPDRVPGQTGAAGTYFNQHTTWIKPGRAWIDYLRRSQSLLQRGQSVCDLAYFIGEDVPCRALIPPEYGSYFVTDPAPPAGYDFDSVNQDVLLNHTSVKNGKILLDSGVSYELLVLRPGTLMTPALINRVKDLVKQGAKVVGQKPEASPSLEMTGSANQIIEYVGNEVWSDLDGKSVTRRSYGKGTLFWGKSMEEVLVDLEVSPDLLVLNQEETETGEPYKATSFEPHGVNPTLPGNERTGWGFRWIHRQTEDADYYFISNQEQFGISADLSFRMKGKVPELWHADTGKIEDAPVWREEDGRIVIPYEFDPAGSVFVIFRKSADGQDHILSINGGSRKGGLKLKLEVNPTGLEHWTLENGEWTLGMKSGEQVELRADHVPDPLVVEGEWKVSFPLLTGTIKQEKMAPGSWTGHADDDIRYFSGTATYEKSVRLRNADLGEGRRLFLDLGEVKNLAAVKVNGKDLGVTWKPPYRVEITEVAVEGDNSIELEVTNTWHNRLAGDAALPEEERRTWVVGGGVQAGSELVQAGLLGPVAVRTMVKI
jgi:hypothetical protein